MAIKYGGNERGWSMKMTGLKELEKAMLKDLPNATNRRVLLSSMRKASEPMVQVAKDNVPKGGSGALAESIGMKTFRNRGGNKQFAAIGIAPMSGNMVAWAKYMTFYGRTLSLKDKRTGKWTAANIGRIRHGHLVEFGFKHKSGKQVPARPFLRKAFDQRSAQLVESFRSILGVKVKSAVKKIKKAKR